MSLSAEHPEYSSVKRFWEQVLDCIQGEHAVKARTTRYLPYTIPQTIDGAGGGSTDSIGDQSYENYIRRAIFHDITSDTVDISLGVMHLKQATFELGPLEFLREEATNNMETILKLLFRINLNQLSSGRCGLLADISVTPSFENNPYFVLYEAPYIINWDDGRFVIFKENYLQENNFNWSEKTRYRVIWFDEEGYRMGVFENGQFFTEGLNIIPNIRGRRPEELPFTFINSLDTLSMPDLPPLLNLSNVDLAIYRNEADYQLNLHMQSQSTAVLADEDSPEEDDETLRLGAGHLIRISEKGKFTYTGPDGDGIKNQREGIQDLLRRGETIAGNLLANDSSQAESGEALRIRVGSKTTRLRPIAENGAEGLTQALRKMALWNGASESSLTEIEVIPNTDYIADTLDAEMLNKLLDAKSKGAPITNEDIVRYMQEKSFTEDTYEEILAKLQAENAENTENEDNTEENEENEENTLNS